MTQDELETAILQRWENGWEALHPADPSDPDHVPWTTDNESYDAAAVWAHVAIEPTVRVRTTQGRAYGRYSARGIIRVRLFGDINVGASQLAQLADDAIGVLEEARIDSLILREASQRKGPSDGRWEMRVVTVPYESRT